MGGQLRPPAQLHPCRHRLASDGGTDCDDAAAAAGLLLLLLLLRSLLLLLPTLESPTSPGPPSLTRTRTSSAGGLRTAGVQGRRVHHPLHSHRLLINSIFFSTLSFMWGVTDDLSHRSRSTVYGGGREYTYFESYTEWRGCDNMLINLFCAHAAA